MGKCNILELATRDTQSASRLTFDLIKWSDFRMPPCFTVLCEIINQEPLQDQMGVMVVEIVKN
jgi:hypothetical protein